MHSHEKHRFELAAWAEQLSIELKQCTMPTSDVHIITWIQRLHPEQDGQVIVVKQICKSRQ